MGLFNLIKPNTFTDGISRSHQYRYFAARGYVEPGDIVIDAACGSGYGTELLSTIAKKVIGIDRSEEAVSYAMKNHKKDNNYFICTNLDQMEKLPECDVAISIESIEHLRFPGSFASKLKLAARKRIFLTTPVIPTMHEDSTHLHDFNEQMIIDMFSDHMWGCIDSARQGPFLLISFFKK